MQSKNDVHVRPFDSSYGSIERDTIKQIAADTWPENPTIYGEEGFVMQHKWKSDIVGFALYDYVKPERLASNKPLTQRQSTQWFEFDFQKHLNSFLDTFSISNNQSDDKQQQHQQLLQKVQNNAEYLRCSQLNPNLKDLDNWNLLQSHIVNITDFAIIASFRGRGYGTFLLQTLIYSFPRGTRFGLEVPADNHAAINCYGKCGFVIERKVADYYAKGQAGLKMVLISSYNDEDLTKFILSQQPQHTNVNEMCANAASKKMATYRVRYARTQQDQESIQRILTSTWPNHESRNYNEEPLTFVVEETFQEKRQIVGFAQCGFTLLTKCGICSALQNGRAVRKRIHDHFYWYLELDFNSQLVLHREMPTYDEYQAFLMRYNQALFQDRNRSEWNKLRQNLVHIRQFAIDKEHRHKGLGSLLMRHIVHIFPRSTLFGLEVEATNLNAQRLYAKCGFTVQRTLKHYYGPFRDGLKMTLVSQLCMDDAMAYLSKHEQIVRPQEIQKNTVYLQHGSKQPDAPQVDVDMNEQQEMKEEKANEAQPHNAAILAPCVLPDFLTYNVKVRAFDTYLDGVRVEAMLNDKRSWTYWPYIDSSNGFVMEDQDKQQLVAYMGYQEVQPMDVKQIRNVDNSTAIGWVNTDFEGMQSAEQVVYISQFCVDFRYRSQQIACKLLSHFINSFADKTWFAVEVETTNKFVMDVFDSFGFAIKRTILHFYDFNRNAHKLTTIKSENQRRKNTSNIDVNDKYCNDYKMIENALKYMGGTHWKQYLSNFQQEQVTDADLVNLTDEDLKCLVTKIGPRSRIRKWLHEWKQKQSVQ